MAADPGSSIGTTIDDTGQPIASDPAPAAEAPLPPVAGAANATGVTLATLPGTATTWAQFQTAFDHEGRVHGEGQRPRPSESRLRLLYRVCVDAMCGGCVCM